MESTLIVKLSCMLYEYAKRAKLKRPFVCLLKTDELVLALEVDFSDINFEAVSCNILGATKYDFI